MKTTLKITTWIILSCLTVPVMAWVYPEHRDITLAAVKQLNPQRRSQLDALWAAARKGFESRLTVPVIDPEQGLSPQQLDFAAWPAIGGDHSVSPSDLMHNVLETEWILKVAAVAARLRQDLATARNESERNNRLRDSDIRLLRADPEYVSRAGGNYGHFLMSLPDVGFSAVQYFDSCRAAGTPLNIVGIYTWFHTSALIKARMLANRNLTAEERSAVALAALADEAFAIHFLEDNFASGHVAGIWGDASQRKGTHDYYNEAGLEVITWNGEKIILMGDAWIRPQDIDRAAATVAASLEQFLDVAGGYELKAPVIEDVQAGKPDTLNAGKLEFQLSRNISPSILALCNQILITTPSPGLATGAGALPRFSSELGPFIGIAPAFRGNVMSGGFGKDQVTAGFTPGLEIAMRVGLGMDGVMNESGDGLVFIDLGWRLDGASTMRIYNDKDLKQLGSFATAIPNRDAYYARLRMPFFLIPGDLILAAPFLLIFSPENMNKMIVTAGNGGLIPWQSGMVTSIGRFQFVLGREVGLCLYGTGDGPDKFLMPNSELDLETVISMYSTQLEFPIIEYQFLRTYGSRQSANLKFQIHAGVDFPGKRKVIWAETDPYPPVKNVWFIGARFVFAWRHYFTLGKHKG